MKILIHGSTGRMGKILCQLLEEGYPGLELAARVSPEEIADPAHCIYTSLQDVDCQVDGVIDFSHHTAVGALMDFCMAKNLPVVVSTTGHTPEEKEIIAEAAKKIPVFFSANMSIGVALVAELAKKAASVFPDANIEIVEKHHNQKLDVPSGTALLLAHLIQEALTDSVLLVGRHENGKRTAKEIGIHSLRLGNEVGTHEIIITTGAETITLKHEAENRSLFANGALAAVKFLEGKAAALYSMRDII